MSLLEWAGFLSGAAAVWLAVRLNVWNWPVGIVNSACWLLLFTQTRLYMNAGLQVVYIVLALLGWYWWLHGGANHDRLEVTRTSHRHILVLASVAVAATAVLWWTQARYTDSVSPFADSATTVASLVAQWMLMRKLLGNWYVWIAVDVAYVVLYSQQQLWLTASLQILFIAMCLRGLVEWRRDLQARSTPGPLDRLVGPDPVAGDGPGPAPGLVTS
jgi:nicotinamide mononucleotide transporter